MNLPCHVVELEQMCALDVGTVTLPASYLHMVVNRLREFEEEARDIMFERDALQIYEAQHSRNPPKELVFPVYWPPEAVSEGSSDAGALDAALVVRYKLEGHVNYRVPADEASVKPPALILAMVEQQRRATIRDMRGLRALTRFEMLTALMDAEQQIAKLKEVLEKSAQTDAGAPRNQ